MFFLLRCVFWLGLVFFNMDWTGGQSLLPTTEQVAQEATARCLDSPEACAQIVAGAQKLYTASIGEKTAAKPSIDTLSAGDRAPAWHGPKP
jgi:hypothetical protein